jgi:hypothetical protein
MSEPESQSHTPSASKWAGMNIEQAEARQAEIDRERLLYIESLSPENKAQFLAVESAVRVMREVQVPFYLYIPSIDNPGHWAHYTPSYSTDQKQYTKDYGDFMWRYMWSSLQTLTDVWKFTFHVEDSEGGPVGTISYNKK